MNWNIPKLVNKIASDVPALNSLIQSLVKWGVANNDTEVPAGAKRLADVSDGTNATAKQIQAYNGTNWDSVGRLKHDSDSVDGFHAQIAVPAANASNKNVIPVRNGEGKIEGDVTGNAATASSVAAANISGTVPIEKGGTGAGGALADLADIKAAARANLGCNNASNINAGTLDVAYGGTGRNDGAASDVVFSAGGNTTVMASSLGQIGIAIAAKSDIDCDSFVQTGKYDCSGCTVALHYPASDTHWIVETVRGASSLVQTAWSDDGNQVCRRKAVLSGGAWTFSGWLKEDANVDSAVNIYIASDGADANTGLDADHPVNSIGRAVKIAKGMRVHGGVVLRFGPGEWGDVGIYGSELQCASIKVTNYFDTGENSSAGFDALTGSAEPPHFTRLLLANGRFIIGNIKSDEIIFDASTCSENNTFSFGHIGVSHGNLILNRYFIIHNVANMLSPVFSIDFSKLYINADASFVDSPTNNAFIESNGCCDIYVYLSFYVTGTFAGKKFSFTGMPVVRGKSPRALPGTIDGTGQYIALGELHIECQYPLISMHNSQTTKGTNPSSNKYWSIPFFGSGISNVNSTNRFGLVEGCVDTSGNVQVYLAAYKNITDSNSVSSMGIAYDVNGSTYGYCPTPPNNDRSTKIATTAYIGNCVIPQGTKMLFQQSSAPSGWAKIINANWEGGGLFTQSSGEWPTTGGDGVLKALNSLQTFYQFMKAHGQLYTEYANASGTTDEKTLSTAMLASHSHKMYNKKGAAGSTSHTYYSFSSASGKFDLANANTGAAGSGNGHTHSFTCNGHHHRVMTAFAMTAVIIAQKS